MRSAWLSGSAALLLLAACAPAASAQRVVIRQEPEYRRNPPVYDQRPARRDVYDRDRVIVVQRAYIPKRDWNRRPEWWRRNGFRPVTVYVVDGRYYERRPNNRKNVRTVVVYERAGRFWWDGGRYDDHDHSRYDRKHDRYDRKDGRYDDDHDRWHREYGRDDRDYRDDSDYRDRGSVRDYKEDRARRN